MSTASTPRRFLQADRVLQITTALPEPDALLVERITGTEALSELFQFNLDLLAEFQADVKFDSLIGQSVTVSLATADGGTRYFNGIVASLTQGDPEPVAGSFDTLFRFHAEVVPKVWLLHHTVRSRVFQQKTVPEILKAVLAGFDFDATDLDAFDTQDAVAPLTAFAPRNYCVQYRESDFDFLSRLMEEEGIFYYFDHAKDKHTMVLAQKSQSHKPITGEPTVSYQRVYGDPDQTEMVVSWSKTQKVRSTKYTLWDHNFEMPDSNLAGTGTTVASVKVGAVDHPLNPGGADREVYDFPGGHAWRFDGVDKSGGDAPAELQKPIPDGQRTARVRAQQEAAPALKVSGAGNCPRFAPGRRFTLKNHFNADGDYVLTRVDHTAAAFDVSTDAADAAADDLDYGNSFECVPEPLRFRPPLATRRPKVEGPQTAVVVGPAGEEIYTDKYGRVKVQFYWDREGAKDGSSSCWVRVGSIWAGQRWGGMHIPRVGQEVIVAFLEGDPDRPIVVGSVYNAENMPYHTMPDNKTISGLVSRSTLKGSIDTCNMIIFEDKKGEEKVTVHAEKDHERTVENNDALTVGVDGSPNLKDGSQTVTIYKDRTVTLTTGSDTLTIEKDRTVKLNTGSDTLTIEKDRTVKLNTGSETVTINKDRTVTLETGSDTLTVKKDRTATLQTGSDTLTINQNRSVTVQKGNDSLTVSAGNQTTKVSLGKSSTEAMTGIELKVGESSVVISPTGVTIKAMMVKVEGTAMVQVKGPMTKVNGDGMLMLKGGVTMIN